eukprot:s4078_g6.t1
MRGFPVEENLVSEDEEDERGSMVDSPSLANTEELEEEFRNPSNRPMNQVYHPVQTHQMDLKGLNWRLKSQSWVMDVSCWSMSAGARPDTPDGPEGSELEIEIPELGDGRLMLEHECRGHWPYRGGDDCVQSRGRTPARRVRDKHEVHPSLAADFLFVAGKHWKVLVILMIHTGMVGMEVCGGDRDSDVKSTASVLNEIGMWEVCQLK